MAIIDVVKFDGTSDIFAWKFPNTELATWSQLVVHETQEAILFKGGQALDLFGPGRHTLNTQNIPILQSVINLPFGGQSPFTAEVWFVNKINALDVKWGTAKPLQLQDPRYQIILPVRAYGQFGVQIEDSRKFLLKLIGTMPMFNVDALRKHFRGVLMMNIHEIVTSYLVNKKISILEINVYISEIAKHIEERIRPVFQDFGIKLVNFFVESINTPEDDPAKVRLKEALAKKAEMDIIGYTYQQERTFNTLENAAKNEGTGGDMIGAGLGMGMGFGLGGGMGNQIAGLTSMLDTSVYNKKCPRCATNNRQEAYFCIACGHHYAAVTEPANIPHNGATCNACGKSFPSSAKFCPHCGDPHNPCPKCGADNAPDAAICINCDYSLMAATCNACGERVDPNGNFCMHCGVNLAVMKCGNCRHDIKPGQKFCLSCGNQLNDREG